MILINFTPNADDLCYIDVPVYQGITVGEVRSILYEALVKMELRGHGRLINAIRDVPHVHDAVDDAIENLWKYLPDDHEVLEEEAYTGSTVAFYFHGSLMFHESLM